MPQSQAEKGWGGYRAPGKPNIQPMLFYCWPTVSDVGPTLKQLCFNYLERPYIELKLVQWCAGVVDGGPALAQYWLLGGGGV